MTLNERQYERVARRLDGEDIPLTDEEQAAVKDIFRTEAALAAGMKAEVPRGALDRTWRRTAASLARPQRRLLRIGAWVAAAAAAAAVLLVVVTLANRKPPVPGPQDRLARPDGQTPRTLEEDVLPYDMVRLARASADDGEIEWLAQQVEEFEAELLVSLPPPTVDVGIESLEREVDDFWLEEPPPVDSL